MIPDYKSSKKIDHVQIERIYRRLEPQDKEIIDKWRSKLSGDASHNGGANAMEAVFIRNLGQKGALELVVKLAMFVVQNDPCCRAKTSGDGNGQRTRDPAV